MRVLLDTNVLIWVLATPEVLSKTVRQILSDPANDVFFSAVTIWEIAIKASLGRADFGLQPDDIAESARESGFTGLPIDVATVARVVDLPLLHRDPFDRLLVTQAITTSMRLYTADAKLRAYSDLVHLVR